MAEPIEPQALSDLAEALHNIPDLLLDYGRWIDEPRYRKDYLRRFDDKWAERAFSLEAFILERLEMYGGDAGNR